MAGTPEEVARQFKEHARVQREQLEMIRAQRESIVTLKHMLSQLLKEKKKPKGRTSSKKSKGKRKEGDSLPFANTESEEYSNSEPPKSSSEEEDNLENGSSHYKGISKLEQRLEALAN